MKLFLLLVFIGFCQILSSQFKRFERDRLPVPEFSIHLPDSVSIVKLYKATAKSPFSEHWDTTNRFTIHTNDYIFENGKLKKRLNFNGANLISSVVYFKYVDNQLISIEDKMGTGKIKSKWEFKDGKLAYEMISIEPGEIYREWFHEYKNDKEVKGYKRNSNSKILAQYENQFDSLGNLVSYKEYKNNKLKLFEEHIINNSKGGEKINYYSFLNKKHKHIQVVFRKDTVGNFEYGEVLNSKDSILGTFRATLDSNKNLIDYKVFNKNGIAVWQIKREIDSLNHIISEEGFRRKQKAFNHSYNYNSFGQLIESKKYYYDLLNIRHLYYREKNIYDKNGNIIHKQIFDKELKVLSSFKYKYEKKNT